MLARIEQLSEHSSFRLAQDWPLECHLLTAIVNELKAMRGDLWALLGKERLPFKPLLPPSSQRMEEARRSEVRAVHDQMMAQMRGGGTDG